MKMTGVRQQLCSNHWRLSQGVGGKRPLVTTDTGRSLFHSPAQALAIRKEDNSKLGAPSKSKKT